MSSPAIPAGAQVVVRRITVFAILFALVVVGSLGLGGLLGRALGAGRVVAADPGDLALSLAYSLVGVPFAAVLWRWQRRRLAERHERASMVWAIYVTAMSVLSLVVATVALASAAAGGIGGLWRPGELATGTVWLGVWLWHRRMRIDPRTAPVRLVGVAVVLSSTYGIAVLGTAAVSALAAPIRQALIGDSLALAASSDWGVRALQALAWGAVGAAVWVWHWYRERGRDASGAFASVLLVLVVGVAAATALFATGTLVFVALRLATGAGRTTEILDPLDVAVASALVAGMVWVLYSRELAGRPSRVRNAERLVVSGVALIGAASGFGVTVNAMLAGFGGDVVAGDSRTLLWGGLSALLVGAIAWWIAWRPARGTTPEAAAGGARRVYLVTVFGVSAIVAIVALLIIGYRAFEVVLDPADAAALIERIRAPLGLLSATLLVSGYHLALWLRDRGLGGPGGAPSIGRIILVTAGDPGGLGEALRAAVGAPVTIWRAVDGEGLLTEADAPAIARALDQVSAARVIVVAGRDGDASVVALAD